MADHPPNLNEKAKPADPIFILGILPRCGTNFLSDLLCEHPDCGAPAPIWEDFLVAHADLLDRYVSTVCGRWDPSWDADEATRTRLALHLGSGLLSFLAEHADAKRVVTKTPRVDNLDYFFRMFPDAYLLILVRDGRAVVESGVKTFGWYRDSAIHKWADAARTILEFDAAHKASADTKRYRIVRYEDLWTNLEEELHAILVFLDLDVNAYDFRVATSLPVRGSSTVRQRGSDAMHWEPVEKASDFDPMSRWRDWSRARHERFNWVAGHYLTRLGYELQYSSSNRFLWSLWNAVHDAKWLAIRTFGPFFLLARRRLAGRKSRATPQERTGA